jgi:M6 family metalloprotease-like protein
MTRMKDRKIYLLVLLGLIACNLPVFGVSAWPHPVEVIQPDGSRITVILKGDERLKWALTVDGYSIMRNSAGIFEYAKLDAKMDMVPSGMRAKNLPERGNNDIQFLNTTPKGLSYSGNQVGLMKSISGMYQKPRLKSAQISGSRKYLCILIGFTDKAFSSTKADFEALLNQVGYAADGASGSVYDYYKEASYGQLSLSFTVAGPYMASQNMAYYGANDQQGRDVNPEALVTEAVKLADPDVNYADFDNDKDGTVDGVYIVHAGFGEDSGASANTIWAHTGNIQPLTLDGKSISDYSCSSELRGTTGKGITRIGPICHELGHILGALDFYDTNYTTNGTYDGTGDWDIMASGSWNNNGVTPAHHNPYNKIFVYGWAAARTFTSGSNVTLLDAEGSNNSFYIVNTATSNEFFLLENRQKQKFDSYIPGHGLIIYHVDGNYISKSANEINIGSHQGMYPVCANATGLPPSTYGTINSTGLPFPGSGNKTSFTDLTIPNSLSWALAKTNAPITGIAENNVNKTISFTAPVIPNRPVASVANPASNILQTTMTANWELSATATSYRLDVSTSSGFATFVTGYNDTDVGNVKSISVSGLNPRTVYYYRVRGNNLGGSSDNSNVISLTTLSTPAVAPTKLTAVSCSNLVTLQWRKNTDPYVRRYRIYWGTTGNPTTKMDSAGISSSDTTKVITGLIHGQNYYFRVTAVNDDGPESAFSNQASTPVKTGVIPVISAKWGDVLICFNVGDSIKSYQWYNNNILIPQATGQFYASNKLPGAYFVLTADYDGCLNSSNTISNLGLKSLTVFPNPATSGISLRLNDPLEGQATVSIINSSGIKVMEFRVTNGGDELLREIPVNNLEEGIYVVYVLVNQKDVYSAKFIVKK